MVFMVFKLWIKKSKSSDQKFIFSLLRRHSRRTRDRLYIMLSKIFSILILNSQFIEGARAFYSNRGQLKNPAISGALYTSRIRYKYTETQCEVGARDVRVL